MTPAEQARLEAAERVCLLFGWSPSRTDTDMEKATMEAWIEWLHVSHVSTDKLAHRALANQVPALAAMRDATSNASLRGLIATRSKQDGTWPDE